MTNRIFQCGVFALVIGLGASASAKDRPLASTPVVRLAGFRGIVTGDHGGKTVRTLIREQDVARIVVLRNNTSAPDYLHIARIGRILRKDSDILPSWTVDKKTGNRTRSAEFKGNVFFSALLVSKKHEYVGFQLTRDSVRIITKDGAGIIADRKDARKAIDGGRK